MKHFRLALALVAGATFLAACGGLQSGDSAFDGNGDGLVVMVASSPMSDAGVVPTLYDDGQGGNYTCEEAGITTFTSARTNWEDTGFATEFTVDLFDAEDESYTTVTVTTDGTYVAWSSPKPIALVIVKGGSASNVYAYGDGTTEDGGLAAPPNASGNAAGLSNVTFCANAVEDDEVELTEICEWVGETAWSSGERYVGRGNWATYTPYDGDAMSVQLLAGRTMQAGVVAFGDADDGYVTITITLHPDMFWRLAPEVDEEGLEVPGSIAADAVKVQGYDGQVPTRNPAPGRFATYKGNELEFTVPVFDFYGIHLDVEWGIACE